MSELSDDARELARTLAGLGCTYRDGALQSAHSWNPSRYEREDFLRIAQAALELAGVKIQIDEFLEGDCRTRSYSVGEYEDCIAVSQRTGERPDLDVFSRLSTEDHPVESAAILLHAARTAREWASEGGES